jgi:hypothetical protein
MSEPVDEPVEEAQEAAPVVAYDAARDEYANEHFTPGDKAQRLQAALDTYDERRRLYGPQQ